MPALTLKGTPDDLMGPLGKRRVSRDWVPSEPASPAAVRAASAPRNVVARSE